MAHQYFQYTGRIQHFFYLSMNAYIDTPFRWLMALVISLSLVSGCSSSSPGGAESSTGNGVIDSGNPIGSDDAVTIETSNGLVETGGEGSNENGIESTSNLARVSFDITVPFYLSNELQVRLVSNDINTTATWITGVSWMIVEDFQANMEHPLMFTFYDENGGIELGSVDTSFSTGNGATDFLQVTADQWDIDRWDNDSDGISNLMELWQGSDPLSASNAAEPIAANFVQAFSFMPSIESRFSAAESDIPVLGQPVSISEKDVSGSITTTRDITLSTDGNGTFSDTWYNSIPGDFDGSRNLAGTRSSLGNTVSWSGEANFESPSTIAYRVSNEVFDVSSTINGRELRQSATSTRSYPSFFEPRRLVHSYDIVLDLDTIDSEGRCAVSHGSLSQTLEVAPDKTEVWVEEQVYTANRIAPDARWEWSITADGITTNGQSIALENRFYCDFQFQRSASRNPDERFIMPREIEWASSLYENELLTHRLPANIQSQMTVQSAEFQTLSSTRDINISAEGNGTFSGVFIDDKINQWILVTGSDFEANSNGTRTSQEKTVSWTGTEAVSGRLWANSYDETMFKTSSTIDGTELIQAGTGSIKHRVNALPARRYQYDVVLDLTSINSEKKCSVLRGKLSFTTEYYNEDLDQFELSEQAIASRSSTDESWAWTSIVDGEMQSGLASMLGNRFHCEYLFNQRF